jgi:hypothetical protein
MFGTLNERRRAGSPGMHRLEHLTLATLTEKRGSPYRKLSGLLRKRSMASHPPGRVA